MTAAVSQPSKFRAWYQAARPRTLVATYIPIFLAGGIAIDDGTFHLLPFLLALIAALSLQIASNLINEYADHVRGSDVQKVAGMGMVIKGNALTPQEVLIGAIATVLVGVVIGLYLVTQTGPMLLVIGMIGVAVVILYTAGPFPLAYLGLGEIAVFLCFGPLMLLGAYYVISSGSPSVNLMLPILASLPTGCTISNILHANNLRDLEADRAARKMTLPARFGLKFARLEYTFWMMGAYLSLVLLVAGGWIKWTALIALATIPEALRLIEISRTTTDPMQLHVLQGRTARFHRDFGLCVVGGWLTYTLIRVLLLNIR